MSFTIEQFQHAVASRVDRAVSDALDNWRITDHDAWLYADMDGLGLDLVDRADNGYTDEDYAGDTADEKFVTLLDNVRFEVGMWFDDYRDTLDITGFNGTIKAMQYMTAHPSDIQHVEEYFWFPAVTDTFDKVIERKGPEDTIIAIANAVLYNRVWYMIECLREEVYSALDSFTVNDIEGE